MNQVILLGAVKSPEPPRLNEAALADLPKPGGIQKPIRVLTYRWD